MVTLEDVKNYLNNCKYDGRITAQIRNEHLELYRYDLVEERDILIAKINEYFDVIYSDEITYFDEGEGIIEDIETASVSEVVAAILYDMKSIIAETLSVIEEDIKFIDEVLESNELKGIKIITCNGKEY